MVRLGIRELRSPAAIAAAVCSIWVSGRKARRIANQPRAAQARVSPSPNRTAKVAKCRTVCCTSVSGRATMNVTSPSPRVSISPATAPSRCRTLARGQVEGLAGDIRGSSGRRWARSGRSAISLAAHVQGFGQAIGVVDHHGIAGRQRDAPRHRLVGERRLDDRRAAGRSGVGRPIRSRFIRYAVAAAVRLIASSISTIMIAISRARRGSARSLSTSGCGVESTRWLAQDVAHAALGVDQRRESGGIDLTPQIGDIGLHDPGFAAEVVIPHVVRSAPSTAHGWG